MDNRRPRWTLCTIPHRCTGCHLSPLNIHAGFLFVVNCLSLLTSALACNHSITATNSYRSPNTTSLTFDHHTKPTAATTCAKGFLYSLLPRLLIFFQSKTNTFYTLEMIILSPIYKFPSYPLHFRANPYYCTKICVLVPFPLRLVKADLHSFNSGFQIFKSGLAWIFF